MKSAIVAVLCLAFAIRTTGQTTTTYDTGIGHGTPPIPTVHSEIPNSLPAVTIDWHYDAQQKTLTLHLANFSGKDITAYSISISEKYADGSTNPAYVDGRPSIPGERMEDMLGAIVNFQLAKTGGHGVVAVGVLVNGQKMPGTLDVERMQREFGNGTFAAGTTRDQVIPEDRDISDVTAVVDMVIYADATADVQNERAFRQLGGYA